jgi:hypothetical protein
MDIDADGKQPASPHEPPAAEISDEDTPNAEAKRRKRELNRARQAYVDSLVGSHIGKDGKVPRDSWATISDDVRGVLKEVDTTYAAEMERAAIFAGLVDKWGRGTTTDKATKRLRRVFLEDCVGASTGAFSDEQMAGEILECDARTLRRCRSTLESTPVELTLGERAQKRTKRRSDAFDEELRVKIKDFVYAHCKYNADKNPPKHLHVMTLQQLHQLWCQTHDRSGVDWPYGTPAWLQHQIRLLEGEVAHVRPPLTRTYARASTPINFFFF